MIRQGISVFNRAMMAIGAGVIFLAAVSGGLRLLPAQLWFAVGDVVVHDAKVGECPTMAVDRTIRRPFRAEWTVTIMREVSTDAWATVTPAYEGANDYRPGNSLPPGLTVAWWAGIPAAEAAEWCARTFAPGTHRVHTLWAVETALAGDKIVRRESNPFVISEDTE